jgi:hypothetical protein
MSSSSTRSTVLGGNPPLDLIQRPMATNIEGSTPNRREARMFLMGFGALLVLSGNPVCYSLAGTA